MSLELKYFVVNPTSKDRAHALASREAIKAYASFISVVNPELSKDLMAWIGKLDTEECK